jgi:uncharacterized membrane protein (UPF0136 family)
MSSAQNCCYYYLSFILHTIKNYLTGSIPSLGAGLLFGSILCYGAYQTSQNPNNFMLMLGTSAALGGLMGYRFYNSGKFMPAGLVTILR